MRRNCVTKAKLETERIRNKDCPAELPCEYVPTCVIYYTSNDVEIFV